MEDESFAAWGRSRESMLTQPMERTTNRRNSRLRSPIDMIILWISLINEFRSLSERCSSTINTSTQAVEQMS
jgi:hypothetical protein